MHQLRFSAGCRRPTKAGLAQGNVLEPDRYGMYGANQRQRMS